jgi:peptidoglycan/xylan/chitin deacetylase (PgdA/CDA1 family)
VFEASHRFTLFDYFRVPYEVRPLHPVLGGPAEAGLRYLRLAEPTGTSLRYLVWPSAGGQLGKYEVQGCTFFAHLTSAMPQGTLQPGRLWHPAEPVLDAVGRPAGAVWRTGDGSVFLPFDPGEVMEQYWSERYLTVGRSCLRSAASSSLRRIYYLSRPAMPRALQIVLRRRFVAVQARSTFPGWPIENSLHDLYRWLFSLISDFAGAPVPLIDLWPSGRSWAMVLTHDVETAAGRDDIDLLRDAERELGYRSSWNFVGERYPVSDEIVGALKDEGCEVGVHGLRHDGHDLESLRTLRKRLPAMREYAERWQAVGFRSPSTQRTWHLMPLLGFDYDSSYSDTDPYEPQPGGCCTYLPYFNEDLVELPITLPQDHTLFKILADQGGDVWLSKARQLRERHGMALVLTHPDYARAPRLTDGYRALLATFKDDDTVWHALPSEAARWWRIRAASVVRRGDGGWRIDGPAATEGQIRLVRPGEMASV